MVKLPMLAIEIAATFAKPTYVGCKVVGEGRLCKATSGCVVAADLSAKQKECEHEF